MTWTCGFCLNTGARPIGRPEKPSHVSQERWDEVKEFRVGRWIRCLACNANIENDYSGVELATGLTQEQRIAIVDSPSNRGF